MPFFCASSTLLEQRVDVFQAEAVVGGEELLGDLVGAPAVGGALAEQVGVRLAQLPDGVLAEGRERGARGAADLDAIGVHERDDDGDGVGVTRLAVGLEGVGEDLVVLGLHGVAGDALAERLELAEGPAADVLVRVLARHDERGDGVVAQELHAAGDVGTVDVARRSDPGGHLADRRGGRDVRGGAEREAAMVSARRPEA